MCASTRFVRFALPLVTVVGSVAGCATPGPIVRLDPRTPDRVVWVAGRAVLETEQAGVRVAAAFEHQESAGLGVRIEIENGTAAPFEVGPAGITFMTCKSLDNATCDGSWSVVDPESMLEDLDQAQSRTVANATNQAAFDTTLVLLNAVGDVGTVASGRADATTGLGTVAAANNAEANLTRAQGRLGSIASERELWSNVALRRTTLAPGRGASGVVYLPVNIGARYIWVHVRAGGQVFPFGFKQTVRQVGLSGSRRGSQT